MSRGLAVLIGAGAGCLIGMQAPINARLGRSIGAVQAASFSFLAGTFVLVSMSFVLRGGLGSFSRLGEVPWWALLGGVLGAIYVFVAIEVVRTLGASGLTAVVITGQFVVSVAIDRFGLLGVARSPIGVQRVLGLVLLLVGVTLVVRK